MGLPVAGSMGTTGSAMRRMMGLFSTATTGAQPVPTPNISCQITSATTTQAGAVPPTVGAAVVGLGAAATMTSSISI